MITEKTITTWLMEFNRTSDAKGDGLASVEYLTRLQGQLIRDEPMVVAMLSNLYGSLKIENPLSAAIIALALYHECSRRQAESDDLEHDLGADA